MAVPVAWNRLLTELGRASIRRTRPLERGDGEAEDTLPEPPVVLPGELADDLLRMLFVCCHASIPGPSQLVLALHTLCGFSVAQIAARQFTSEANVYKRLSRARERLRSGDLVLEPTHANLVERLPRVHRALYALFAEGHLSSSAEASIRRDLCHEALRLGLVLADHPTGDDPATAALVALMLFHAARLDSRQGPTGDLVLLEDQDRGRWDADLIRDGVVWLERAGRGSVCTRYHVEAAIAAEHCLAPDLRSTRWDRVAPLRAPRRGRASSPRGAGPRPDRGGEEGPDDAMVEVGGALRQPFGVRRAELLEVPRPRRRQHLSRFGRKKGAPVAPGQEPHGHARCGPSWPGRPPAWRWPPRRPGSPAGPTSAARRDERRVRAGVRRGPCARAEGPLTEGRTFTAALFRFEGPGGWTFVEVPPDHAPIVVGPWGRTPVYATVDGSTWPTSVWTERTGRVLLAVPERVRSEKAEGDVVTVSLAPR